MRGRGGCPFLLLLLPGATDDRAAADQWGSAAPTHILLSLRTSRALRPRRGQALSTHAVSLSSSVCARASPLAQMCRGHLSGINTVWKEDTTGWRYHEKRLSHTHPTDSHASGALSTTQGADAHIHSRAQTLGPQGQPGPEVLLSLVLERQGGAAPGHSGQHSPSSAP